MIAHDPCLDRVVAAAGLDHGWHELMIGQRLVDEAFPARVDGNNARLAAIDEVRKRDLCAVGLGHERNGRPGRRLVYLLGEVSTHACSDASTITGVRCGRQMRMVLSGCTMAVEPPGHFLIRRKPPRRENDTAARCDFDPSALAFDDCTGHASALTRELDDGGAQP